MERVPYTKDNLHSQIDYKKLIELQSGNVQKESNSKKKNKSLIKNKIYRGEKNDKRK